MRSMLLIWRVFWLVMYYGFARHLPNSYRFQPFGYLSKQVRGLICRNIFKFTGKNVNIERGAYFGSGIDLEIGDNSGIGANCQMPANVKIGSDVMVGPDVLVIGQNHRYDSIETPMRLQGDTDPARVTIEDDVWIGARSIILPGVTICAGVIIGAGAVVTRDVPRYAVCVGNPARVVKYRNESSNLKGRDDMFGDGKADS